MLHIPSHGAYTVSPKERSLFLVKKPPERRPSRSASALLHIAGSRSIALNDALPAKPLLRLRRDLEHDRDPFPKRPIMKQLNHEKLHVYQAAIEFLALATQLLEKIPRGQANLADQLRRASLSIPLNIAEGAGKASRPDCARFFAIARGSALECGAILDAFVILGIESKQGTERGKDLLVAVVSMLTNLASKTGV